MNAPRSGKSYATAWTVVVLVIPALYMLSVAPLGQATMKYTGGVPHWLEIYMEPYLLIGENTPLGKPLQQYYIWWSESGILGP